MATSIITNKGMIIGTRFCVTKGVMAIQMEVSEVEFRAFRDVPVAFEGDDVFVPCGEFFAAQGVQTFFDSAARQNKIACEMETHRFKEVVDASWAMRQRANVVRRDEMRAI